MVKVLQFPRDNATYETVFFNAQISMNVHIFHLDPGRMGKNKHKSYTINNNLGFF